ncbi:MAG: helix-turn-helix domain-containing protein, partial [Acidimicrobiales bacterium]
MEETLQAAAARHGGRPLDPSRDEAICQAALTLLAEVGYDRLTVEAVAARAGAGKATVYRRWASKAALVADALNQIAPPQHLPDTGSLQGDCEVLCDIIAQAMDQSQIQVTQGLTSA